MYIKDIQDYIKMKSKKKDINSLIDDIIRKISQINQNEWKNIIEDVKIKYRLNLPKTYRLALNRYHWENLININPNEAKKAIAIILSINENGKINDNEYRKNYNLLDF